MLDEPEQQYAPDSSDRSGPPRRSSARTTAKLRRDFAEDFSSDYDDSLEDEPQSARPRASQMNLKLKFRSRIPKTLFGRIATGAALLGVAGVGISLLMLARSFLLHDGRFMIASPTSIEIQGNNHLTREQLLGIFGEDVGRNIFRISLETRQGQLEQLPWVQHATVMRLLPGRIRVAVAERTPMAFVRQGSHISLVDASGVLLDMSPTRSGTEPHYSFPVVTGIVPNDPASTRAARMKLFERFTADLDSSGEKVSEILSEVDLSNPEDVKALIPDHTSEILVHFGDDRFLDRYRKFQDHLAEWHTQYPNLSSVDMRYEREVVLDMADTAAAKVAAAKTDAPNAASAAASSQPAKPVVATPAVVAHETKAHAKVAARAPARPLVKGKAKPVVKVAPHKPVKGSGAKMVVKPVHAAGPKPVAKPSTAPARVAAAPPATHPDAGSAPSVSAAARSGFTGKPSAGKPLLSSTSPNATQAAPR